MNDSIVSKLSEDSISSHIHSYEVIEEREVLFGKSTGRKHLYIKFYESAPSKVVDFVSDYFSSVHRMKVVDIDYPYYVMLRVELCSFSNEWLAL